jgi:hypothetical protein
MDKQPKPRCDSVLKTLPPERQREVIELLIEKGMRGTKAHLAEDGLITSLGALSEFYSWWQLREQFKEHGQRADTLMDLLRKEAPELSEEKVLEYGNAFFQAQAIETKDAKTFLKFASARHKGKMDVLKFNQGEKKIAQKDREIEIEVRKTRRKDVVEFVKWYADQRARDILAGADSSDEKTERLGELIFGENWK